jgi:hypothetical protein
MSEAAVLSPLYEKVLQSLHYQGTSNDCAPFTIATVMNGVRGMDIQPKKLADEMDRPVWRGPRFVVRRIPNWATFPWGMVDVFRSYGLRASWRPFADPYTLVSELHRGDILMPILHSWRPLWSHVMTLIAWDPKKGWGFANTQYQRKSIYWIREETFHKQWRALGRLLVKVKNA